MSSSSITEDWDEFVRDWCLGWQPPFDQAYAARALVAVETYWPERIGQMLGSGGRGIGIVAYPINLGATLADVSDCPGFCSVLARARGGESSALSELTFGALLWRNGFLPRFGEGIGGKNLDIALDVDGVTVYIEIVCPETSDRDKEAEDQMSRFRDRLAVDKNRHLSIELFTFPTDEVLQEVEAAIPATLVGSSGELPGKAHWALNAISEGGPRVETRWPGNEHRARRLISAEYHHFAADVPYVLVVDTGHTMLSPEGWTAAFVRVLQPTRNRQLGATVAYRQYVLADDFASRIVLAVHENPHASRAIPTRLLETLSRMNEPILS